MTVPPLEPRPNSPASLGYRWPAEWEPHAATWLSWPHNRNTWPGSFENIPQIFARFVHALARFEPVHINAGGTAVMGEARRLVRDLPNVHVHDFPTNDAWCRDHGPTFLSGAAGLPAALVDWEFNAWGEKYPSMLDNDIPRQIAEQTGRRRFVPGVVMEGGAIDGNGTGVVLTTEACLLNSHRNPHLSRANIEQVLADFLGARRVVWLRGGQLVGDDTDGHVDQLARFVAEDIVVCAVEEDPRDENFAALQTNWRQLRETQLPDGRPLQVIPLPLPRPLFHDGNQDERMPASYCNFYIVNGAVIVPVFDDPRDRDACDTLARLFPTRTIIPLPARELVWGLGAYHCLSQQEPI